MMRQRFVARLRFQLRRGRLLACVAFVGSAVVFQQGTAHPRAQGPITFSQHVAPIMFANCTGCHRPGEAAPFQLMNYRDARPLAKAIAAATASRVMPPWKAGPGDVEFANARQLTTEQIEIIQRWVADGALEGDARLLPALASLHGRVAAWSSRSGRVDERGIRGAGQRTRRLPELRGPVEPRSRRVGAGDRLQAVGTRGRAPQSVLPRRDRQRARARRERSRSWIPRQHGRWRAPRRRRAWWRSRRSAGRQAAPTILRPIRLRASPADSGAGRSVAARSNCPLVWRFRCRRDPI